MRIEPGAELIFQSYGDTLIGTVREVLEDGRFLVGARDEFGLTEVVVDPKDVKGDT